MTLIDRDHPARDTAAQDASRASESNVSGVINAFQAAVAKRDAELDRGEGVGYCPALMESMTLAALRVMESDRAIDPDVIA